MTNCDLDMWIAGQRFRAQNGNTGRFTAEDGAEGDYRYRYQAPGMAQSRNSMPEANVRSMAKIEEPAFNIGNFAEPEFKV